MSRAWLLALVVLVPLAGCITDAKGESCGFLDAYVDPADEDDAEDETYCPDADAADDCDALTDAIIDAAVTCSQGAVSAEQLRADLEDQGALPDCESAVATDLSYDDCMDALDDPPCEPNGTLGALPASCQGAVLIDG